MDKVNWQNNRNPLVLILVGLVCLFMIYQYAAMLAQNNAAFVRQVQEADMGRADTHQMDDMAFPQQAPQGMVFAASIELMDAPANLGISVAGSGLRKAGPNRIDEPTSAIAERIFRQPAAVGVASPQAVLVQTIDTSQFSPPSPDPSGLAYLPHRGTLLVADGEVSEMAQYFTGDNLFELSLAGTVLDTLTTLPYSDEPTGIDINPANRHLFMTDDTGVRSVYELNPGADTLYNTTDDIVTYFSTTDFNSRDPEGIAYARDSGFLYIVDDANNEIYQVSPGANDLFDGVSPKGDDQVTSFDTATLGLRGPQGIAFGDNGNLYAVGKPADTLFEITTAGSLVQMIDISAANAREPAGLAFAPSSQNPAETNIYIVDRGVDNDTNPDENDGKMYEMSLGLLRDEQTNEPVTMYLPIVSTGEPNEE